MANLIYHSQPKTSNVTNVQPTVDDTYWIIGDSNEIAANSEPAISLQPDTHKLNTIIENQNKIIDMQNKFSYRLSNFIVEIETTINKTITRTLSRHLNQSVVNLGDATNAADNCRFKLKPIDSINDLENLELLLMDPVESNKLMKMYSIVCSAADGQGITCAYKLVDLLFTREFLCKCSWSGGSRGTTIKLPLKKYINILDFCFKLIYSWDKTYTIEDNENFFKLILRNAEQRKNCKNLRKPTKRNRLNKKQTEVIKKIVRTYATESEDVGTKTKNKAIMRAEVEEETMREIDMEEEVEEEAVMEDGMVEGITNEIDMEKVVEEKTVNEDSTEEQTPNQTGLEDETTNEIDTGEETTNENDVEEKTTNETEMEEETTDIEERVKEKYDNVMEKDFIDISKYMDENVVRVVQLAEEDEKMMVKDTETEDGKGTQKDIEGKEDLEKEMTMRSYIEKEMEKNKVKEIFTKEVKKEIFTKEKQKINAEKMKKINKIYVKKKSSRYRPKKQTTIAKKIKELHPSSQITLKNQQLKKRLDHNGQSGQTPPKRLKPNATIISDVKTND